MENKDLDNIFAVLHKKVAAPAPDEKPPLAPYQEMKRAPAKFDYEKYTLMPPEDARKINQTLEALNSRAQQIKELDNEYTELRVEVTDKIQGLQQEQGYDKIKTEMSELRDKLAGDVETTLDGVGDALIEHNNVVLTIIESLTAGKVTNTETQKAMVKAIEKYASAEIAGQILKEAEKVLAKAAKAKDVTKRKLISWPSPQDLRKKVMTEQTASVKTAGVMDILQSVVDSLKGLWTSAKDSLSGLVSSVDQAQPVVDEMKGLLADAGVATASKKTAGFGADSGIDNRHDYMEKLLTFFDHESLLEQLVLAMGDDEAFENFDYIVQMNDISQELANEFGSGDEEESDTDSVISGLTEAVVADKDNSWEDDDTVMATKDVGEVLSVLDSKE